MLMYEAIPKFDGVYEISIDGAVRNTKTGKSLIPRVSKKGYWVVELQTPCGNRKLCTIHRLIYETFVRETNKHIDHIDGNTLNNSICNLRECCHRENIYNSKSHKNSTSKYKGVSYDKINKKWKAQIAVNKKTFNLGRYISEEKAALAYNVRAKQEFGEFARLNVI